MNTPTLPNEPNVADYFTAILGRDPSPENVEELNAMPLESNCGAECKRAIDAGQAFRKSVIDAYGDEESTFYPEKAEQVRALTEEVCRVFITG